MKPRTEISMQLYNLMMERGYPENLCDLVTRNLNTDYTSRKGADIADPWYTGNFDATYRDVNEGCDGLLTYILEQK